MPVSSVSHAVKKLLCAVVVASIAAVAGLSPAAAASVPPGYSVTGIDVSKWQGTVNWATVAASARFAYVKATEGTTYVSPTFATQYAGAKAAGLYTGAYAFARPDAPALAQADYFVDNAKFAHDGKTLPPMLDIEWPYTGSSGQYVAPYPCYGLSPADMVTWVRTFVNEVKRRTGSKMMIYTATSWWNPCTGHTTAFGDQYLDVAWYSSTPPTTLPSGWSTWTVWQYASGGALPGDQDVFYGSRAQLTALASTCLGVPTGSRSTSTPFKPAPARCASSTLLRRG